jgi:hypothetical protein
MPLDWLAVPGVTTDGAARLIAEAPFADRDALLASPALSVSIRKRRRAAGARTGQQGQPYCPFGGHHSVSAGPIMPVTLAPS